MPAGEFPATYRDERMTLTDFLSRLSADGIAIVTSDEALEPDDGWKKVIVEWDDVRRSELAFTAPELSLTAAGWAAVLMYRGCQALICRGVSPTDLARFFGDRCPESVPASAAYSVDLLFRFLPDLVKLAQQVARGDPLVVELLKLARAWPLSSVGIADVGDVDAAPLLENPSLRQLYVDRIVAAGDTARLKDSAVRKAVQSSLGVFPELAPLMASTIDKTA